MMQRHQSKLIPSIAADEFKSSCAIMAEAARQAEAIIPKRCSRRQRGAILTMNMLRSIRKELEGTVPSNMIGSMLARFMFMGELALDTRFAQWVDNSLGTPSVHPKILEIASQILVYDTDTKFDPDVFLNFLLK